MFDWIILIFEEVGPLVIGFIVMLGAFTMPLWIDKIKRVSMISQEKAMNYELIKVQALNLINEMIDEINHDEREKTDKSWKYCPNCGSGDTVNKYARVKGDISGDFFLGIGSVDGGVDTEKVKQCSKCGEQFQGRKYSHTSVADIISSLYRNADEELPVSKWGYYGKILSPVESKFGRSKLMFFIENAYDRMDGGSLFPLEHKI